MPKLRPLFKAERSSDVKLWEDKLVITLGEPVILRSSNPKPSNFLLCMTLTEKASCSSQTRRNFLTPIHDSLPIFCCNTMDRLTFFRSKIFISL